MMRRAARGKISRRRAQHPPVHREAPRHQRRILQHADTDRHVDTRIDEIDQLIGQPQIDAHARIAAQKFADHRRHVLPSERRRHRHPQAALRLGLRAADRRARGGRRVEQRFGARHEDFTVLREADAAGGPVQQPRAEQLFQLRDPRTRHRRRQTEFAPRRRHVGEQRGAHEQRDVEQIEPLAVRRATCARGETVGSVVILLKFKKMFQPL